MTPIYHPNINPDGIVSIKAIVTRLQLLLGKTSTRIRLSKNQRSNYYQSIKLRDMLKAIVSILRKPNLYFIIDKRGSKSYEDHIVNIYSSAIRNKSRRT